MAGDFPSDPRRLGRRIERQRCRPDRGEAVAHILVAQVFEKHAIPAPVGKGRVLLYTTQIIMRGLPHQTFKLLFNGIYYSVMNH